MKLKGTDNSNLLEEAAFIDLGFPTLIFLLINDILNQYKRKKEAQNCTNIEITRGKLLNFKKHYSLPSNTILF